MDRAGREDLQELAEQLNVHLGPTLVAALAGASSKDVTEQWAASKEPQIGPKEAARLRIAYEVWDLVCEAESEDVARAWFIGANPLLEGNTPLTAIREDHHKCVYVVATFQATDSGGF